MANRIESLTTLPDALVAASELCSPGSKVSIYYTTHESVTAGVASGELYLLFLGDVPEQYHLRDDQGWRHIFTMEVPRA